MQVKKPEKNTESNTLTHWTGKETKGRHSKHAKKTQQPRFEAAVNGQRTLPRGAAAARQNASILYFTPLGPGSNWGYRSTHSRRSVYQHHQSHISSILSSLLLETTEIVSWQSLGVAPAPRPRDIAEPTPLICPQSSAAGTPQTSTGSKMAERDRRGPAAWPCG